MKTIFGYVLVASAIYVFLIYGIGTLSSLRPEQAKRVLHDSGYTEVTLKPFSPRNLVACSEDDFFRNRFTAKSIQGSTVEGVVCSGFFKGSTIRVF